MHKYKLTFTHNRIYRIKCKNLVDLYKQVQSIMSKHCFYNDELISINQYWSDEKEVFNGLTTN